MSLSFRSIRTAVVTTLLAGALQAGGSPENVLLVVDPTSPISLHVANHYRRARGLPDRNVVYFAPNPGAYANFKDATQLAFLGALENQAIADHVDYVVLTPGIGFYQSAAGLVTDGCAAVTRFSTTAPFALARAYASVPAGTSSQTTNQFASTSTTAIAFDANQGYTAGSPATAGTRYFLAAQLGYEGPLGNTLVEILDSIDRSVAADGTRPSGTFYLCQTTDAARSGPRHGLYPSVTSALTALGLGAQHLMAVLPAAGSNCTGIMTGWADPAIDATAFTFLPGAFADHLTSYAATFDLASQTKMSRWIARGASGTSGTVEEPCNYAGKFPTARLHLYYAQGASLGEAWYRSLGYAPFQVLFLGDPLTRTFAHLPQPTLSGVPGTAASGTIALTPAATTTHPTAGIAGFELLVDGKSIGTTTPGHTFALDTSSLPDGWHELRLLAWDDTPVKSTGRFVTSFESSNAARSITLSASPASGSLTQRFDLSISASGGTVSGIEILQGGRVVASTSQASATVGVFGRTLGSGRVRLQARARYVDQKSSTSVPIEIDVATSEGPTSGALPVAYGYEKHVRNDQTAVIELPAAFDDALGAANFSLTTSPSQGSILLASATAPYRLVKPVPGALGADTLAFTVTTGSGTSGQAVVNIVWEAPATCPAPSNYCIAEPNSTGTAAGISWYGSTRHGENAFGLTAHNLPASTIGLFYTGTAPAQVSFGNGYRCVGGSLVRLGIVPAGAFGIATLPVDLTAPELASGAGAIEVGATRYFQFWFRDVPGGGALFDLTDGLTVTFCP